MIIHWLHHAFCEQFETNSFFIHLTVWNKRKSLWLIPDWLHTRSLVTWNNLGLQIKCYSFFASLFITNMWLFGTRMCYISLDFVQWNVWSVDRFQLFFFIIVWFKGIFMSVLFKDIPSFPVFTSMWRAVRWVCFQFVSNYIPCLSRLLLFKLMRSSLNFDQINAVMRHILKWIMNKQ